MDIAIATATRGAEEMARLPGYERYLILRRAAQLLEERTEELEILLEAGMPPNAIQCITGPGGEIGDACAPTPEYARSPSLAAAT